MNFKQELSVRLNKALGQKLITEYDIEVPPEKHLGDFALPCFKLSKTLKKSPMQIASLLEQKFDKPDFISNVSIVNGYFNFHIDRNIFCNHILNNISTRKNNHKKGETIIIEFSSPNIAKPFHVGHLCSTVIGDSLARIYDKLGYNVIKINYLGDYGTQFGKLISAYKRWVDLEKLNENPIAELFRIYVKFHEEAKKYPDLEAEGRMYFKKLEQGEPDEMMLWKKFKELSMNGFSKIYERLNVQFDSFDGESFYSDKMDAIVSELETKGLLTLSEGAQVVDLSNYNMPPSIILKSDGATIYATRDITAAIYRKNKYNFDKCLYVVGTPQALHFQQVFKILNLMGYEWSNNCHHIGFAHVRFVDGKMSTREGNVVFLEDVLDEAVNRVKVKMENSFSKGDDINYKSEKIGIGAVKFAFLKAQREKEMAFSWDETLDFNGESGPYIQYSYVRAKSILSKINIVDNNIRADYSLEEEQLLKTIYNFDSVLLEAKEKNEPAVIAKYSYLLSKHFNKFYNACPVAGSEFENQRGKIVELFSKTISECLYLLGIEIVENM